MPSTKTTISPSYRWRIGAVGLAMLAFGSWFLYDGMVAYPHKQNIQLEFQKVQKAYPESWQPIWNELAADNGWSTSQPGEPMTDLDIYTQSVFAAICLPIGLLFGVGFIRAGRRWTAIDDQALTTHTGQQVAWDQITSIDKSRWETKGIAVVHYRQGDKVGRVVLDDWKFTREPTREILTQLETHL